MARFEKGNAGGPGRPKGARNKLSEDFISDVQESWKENGAEALKTMKDEDNSSYVKMVASLVPKDYNINVNDMADATQDDVINEIRRIDAALAKVGIYPATGENVGTQHIN